MRENLFSSASSPCPPRVGCPVFFSCVVAPPARWHQPVGAGVCVSNGDSVHHLFTVGDGRSGYSAEIKKNYVVSRGNIKCRKRDRRRQHALSSGCALPRKKYTTKTGLGLLYIPLTIRSAEVETQPQTQPPLLSMSRATHQVGKQTHLFFLWVGVFVALKKIHYKRLYYEPCFGGFSEFAGLRVPPSHCTVLHQCRLDPSSAGKCQEKLISPTWQSHVNIQQGVRKIQYRFVDAHMSIPGSPARTSLCWQDVSLARNKTV